MIYKLSILLGRLLHGDSKQIYISLKKMDIRAKHLHFMSRNRTSNGPNEIDKLIWRPMPYKE